MKEPSSYNSLLGNLHGPVLFEIFKFLHFKHLLSTIVLVNSEWRKIVIECVLEIDLREYHYKEWLDSQVKILQDRMKIECPLVFSYPKVDQLIRSVATFQNTKNILLAGQEDLFGYETFMFMMEKMTNLQQVTISNCSMWKGLHGGRIHRKSSSSSSAESSENRGFFSRLFARKSSPELDNKEAVKKLDTPKLEKVSAVVFDFVRLDYGSKVNVKSFPSLTNLSLIRVKMTTEEFQEIMKCCKVLKKLRLVDTRLPKLKVVSYSDSLSHIEINSQDPFDVEFDSSCKKLTSNLEALSIGGVHFQSDDFTKFISNNVCHKLKFLKIRKYLKKEDLKLKETNVEKLILEGINFEFKIEDLVLWTPKLTTLHVLSSAFLFGDNYEIEFIPRLLQQFNATLKDLKFYNVRNCVSHNFESETLEHLDLSHNNDLECQINCKSLKSLNISNTKMNETQVFFIMMKCNNLQDLNMSKINSEEGVVCATGLKNLRRLDMSYNPSIADERLEEIMKFATELEFLNLKMCKLITSPKISSTSLKSLLLSGTSVTDNVLFDLSNTCPNIERIDINCCTNITQPNLSNFKRLKYLDVSETSLSTNAVLEMVAKLPSLRTLYARWITNLITDKDDTDQNLQILRNLLLLDLTGSVTEKKGSSVGNELLHRLNQLFKDMVIVTQSPTFGCENAVDPFF